MTMPTPSVPASAAPATLVFVLRDLGLGGAERVFVQLANHAARVGHRSHLVGLVGGGPLEDALEPGVTFHRFPGPRIRHGPGRLRKLLRSLAPDAVVSTLPQVNVLVVAVARSLPNRPRIIVREANDPRHELLFQTRAPRLAQAMVGVAYRGADRIVAVSDGVATGVREALRVPSAKLTTLRNATFDDRLTEQAAVPIDDAWFESLARRVTCVARFAPQKDHATLLEAFASPRIPAGVGLLLIGHGPLEADLRQRVDQAGLADRVRIRTGEGNPHRWVARADLAVLASHWEGSPNVLIEAMALGVPVVATDCPSGPSEILDEGRYGRLVPVGDPQALTSAIVAALSEAPDRDALRSRARLYHVDEAGAAFLREVLA